MKTYNEEGVYYQILPYNVSVIYDILRSRGGGLGSTLKFLQNSRWSEEKARLLAERKVDKHQYKLDKAVLNTHNRT